MWSGERKPIEPPKSPSVVRPLKPASSRKLLARPKSESFSSGTRGEPMTRMFEGLMSRWTKPPLVGVVEGRQELDAQVRRGGDRQGAVQAGDPLAGALAVDVFHDELELAVVLEGLVEGDDVAVPEVAEDVHLAEEVAGGPARWRRSSGPSPSWPPADGRPRGGRGRPRPCRRRRSSARSSSRAGRPGNRRRRSAQASQNHSATSPGWAEIVRSAGAAAPQLRQAIGTAAGRLDQRPSNVAVAGRDGVAVAEPRLLDPDAVDLDPVGAAEVADRAAGRVELDEEVVPREEPVVVERELRVGGPADDERRVAIDHATG